ncbi:hypothetical protein CHUAL_012237 [Chamberlinius hualienensis]
MNNLIRRASSFIGISSDVSAEQLTMEEDNEVIFCKNNVCVHPPTVSRGDPEHHPGYLTIKNHHSELFSSSLILCWIPNTTIKRNPRSLENKTPSQSPCHSSRSSACESPRKSRHSLHSINYSTTLPNITSFDKYVDDDEVARCPTSLNLDTDAGSLSEECENTAGSKVEGRCRSIIDSGVGSENVSINVSETVTDVSDGEFVESTSCKINKPVFAFDIELVEENDTIDGLNEDKQLDLDQLLLKKDLNLNLESFVSPERYVDNGTQNSQTGQSPSHSLSESLSINSHELNFEEVAQNCVIDKFSGDKIDIFDGFSSPSCKSTTYTAFSINLCQMKSLRLIFHNQESTCGQLIIASRERRYKILHFHHGGLDKLAKIFEELDFLTKSKEKVCPLPYRLFSVTRPIVSEEECHPEEGLYGSVDESVWEAHLNEYGQIEDQDQLIKAIFFGGLDSDMRSEVWPFLLHFYSFMSTYEERELIRQDYEMEYQKVDQRRETFGHQDKNSFYRNIQCTVEKDVVRTDRSHPFFAGDNNPNVEIMKNILLNYAVYNPSIGYTQGMSDILAPILIEIRKESETFWCFVGLMQRTIFISSPTDSDMDLHLNYIRELIRLMVPNFYKHLSTHPDYMEILFCHRWILLCFKREFSDSVALKMWEACWTQYQTKYFHLFLCVAVVAIYSEDVIQQDMNSDEMLLYFSSLSMHMNGDLVLRKARGLLYQFLQLPVIPCTLANLCQPSQSDSWINEDMNIPKIMCIGHGNQQGKCC